MLNCLPWILLLCRTSTRLLLLLLRRPLVMRGRLLICILLGHLYPPVPSPLLRCIGCPCLSLLLPRRAPLPSLPLLCCTSHLSLPLLRPRLSP